MKHSNISQKKAGSKTKKKAPMSLRAKLTLYFLVFAGVLLSILWIFQVVLLDDFYRFIKEEQLTRCATSLTLCESAKDIHRTAQEYKEKNNMAVGVYNTSEGIFYQTYSSKGNGEYSSDFMPHEVYGYYTYAKAQGGHVTCYENEMIEGAFEDKATFSSKDYRVKDEDMVSARIFSRDGEEYMVLVKSHIAPVQSTVETLRVLLSVISVVFVIFAVIMAVYAASRISKPLTKTNKAAKELAKQNYSVEFEGKGYREIYELSDTLNFASKELSAVDSLRRELVANISHDLRTPLTMIGGYAEVMRDIPGENTSENLQVIIDETERLSRLVTDLLDLSRLESGNIPLEIAEFSLTKMIEGIFARYTKFVEKEEFSLCFEHTGEAFVRGDEARLAQVVYNLINNAINYSLTDKTVTVRQTVADGRVRIEVIDRGSGIEPEKLKDIWDRYYRVDKEHKQAVVGTGLGLSIVKNILSRHGARFGVISRVGEGSNFWFELDAIDKNSE